MMPSFMIAILSGETGVTMPNMLGWSRSASSPPEAAAAIPSSSCVKGRSRMLRTVGLVVLRKMASKSWKKIWSVGMSPDIHRVCTKSMFANA